MKKEGLTAYPEHLGAALGADPLGGFPLILHGDNLGILHLSFGLTFHAISLGHNSSFRLSLQEYNGFYGFVKGNL